MGLREDSRELLALSLREKRAKWVRNSDLCGLMGKVKEEMRWSLFIARPAKSWSLGFVNMHGTLALCVEFPLVAYVGRIFTTTSHASYA